MWIKLFCVSYGCINNLKRELRTLSNQQQLFCVSYGCRKNGTPHTKQSAATFLYVLRWHKQFKKRTPHTKQSAATFLYVLRWHKQFKKGTPHTKQPAAVLEKYPSWHVKTTRRSWWVWASLTPDLCYSLNVLLYYTAGVHSGNRGTDPLILNLDTRWRCVIRFTPLPLYRRERNSVPIEYEEV